MRVVTPWIWAACLAPFVPFATTRVRARGSAP